MSLRICRWRACSLCARISLVVAVLAAAGCGQKSPPAAAVAPPNAELQFGSLEHRYVVFVLSRFPVVATYLGGSAFDPALADIDGKLRDPSAEALQQEDAALAGFRREFTGLAPEQLSPRRRIDRRVALAEIEFLIHQHQVLRHQQRALDSYVDEPFRGVDWQIQGMTPTGEGTYGTEAEWRAVIARVGAVPAMLAAAEKQLAAGVAANNAPDFRIVQDFGLNSTAADADYFANTLPKLAAADMSMPDREALLDDLRKAGAKAAAAYSHLRVFVASTFFDRPEAQDTSGLKPQFRADHYALGEAEYDWALHNNLRLDKTAAELFDESWPTVLESQAAMVSLAREIAASHKWRSPADGPGTVRAVFEQLSRDAPRNDDEMIEGYRKAGERLVAYARATGLFDVPPDYRLDVTPTPPPLRAGLDGGAYYPAPPFKTTGVGRFYVSPTGNDLAMLRHEHNRAAMLDLAAHEGFPGHDWHYKVMTKYRAEISPVRWLTPGAVEDSSSMWQDSMAAEGWALYSEALLSEPQPSAPNGFYSPEERLYQLRGKLYRDLRVRIDTGIHTGRLGFNDAVSLFSQTVDFLPGSCSDAQASRNADKRASCEGAQRAITRYSRWPTQAITYRLGKDQILALRQRSQQELGERFSAKRFHLQFMRQGTIPAGYFGAELLR